MLEKKLIEYETREGKTPFHDWLFSKNIDNVVRGRIIVRLKRLSLGNAGDCEPVGEGVFELKMDFGPGYRVYFAHKGNAIIILLSGGDKSTQKKDVQKAIECWAEYKRRWYDKNPLIKKSEHSASVRITEPE